MFEKFGINEGTSRSKAKRNKVEDSGDVAICCVCFKAFNTKREFRSHIKKVHRCDKEEIKQEFRDARNALKINPDGNAEKWNYMMALLKVTLLERVF